jgi:hypothetical protein
MDLVQSSLSTATSTKMGDLEKPVAKMNKEPVDPALQGTLLPGVSMTEVRLHEIPTLRGKFPSANLPNKHGPSYNQLIGDEDFIIHNLVRKAKGQGKLEAFVSISSLV